MVAKKKKPVKKATGAKKVNMSGKAKANELMNAMGVKTKFPPRSNKAAAKAISKKKLPARKK